MNYHKEANKPEFATEDGLDDGSLTSPLLLGEGVSGAEEHQQPSLALLVPRTVIEQTLRPDGSVSVKASTTTPHVNGYRDVRVEHYSIPASRAACVDLSPGSPPPGGEYLDRVEYRVLSPGLELERPPDDDASTVYTANHAASVAGSYDARRKRRRTGGSRHRTVLLSSAVFVFLAIIVGVCFVRDYAIASSSQVEPTTPQPTPTPATLPENLDVDKNDTMTSPSVDPENNSTRASNMEQIKIK